MKNHSISHRIRSGTLMIVAFLFTATLVTGADTWTPMTDMPTARWSLTTSVVNEKIYAIGGFGGTRKIEEYHPATDTWAKKTDMPTGRGFSASGVIDGKIYVIGGSSGFPGGSTLSAVEMYDPVTDAWTLRADLASPITDHSVSVVGGKIYAIGGWGSGGPVSTVSEYDPTTDTWTRRANMPTARALLSTSVVDGKIYAFGGITTGWPSLSTVEEYDPETDTWTTKENMPKIRGSFSTGVVDGAIYAFGGTAQRGGGPTSDVFKFDRITNSWTEVEDMPARIMGMSTSVVGGSTYVIGGTPVSYPYSSRLTSTWKFTPEPVNDDPDGDGIDTDVEIAHGLDPNVPDADSDHDGDGLKASFEIFEHGTMANNPDTDDDGLNDGIETNSGTYVSATDTGTDPTKADTDGDGQADGVEVASGSDPIDPNSFPGAWPDLITIDALGTEAEGIALGKDHDFFVGAFSYSTWFGAPISPQAGAIYKSNLRSGEGRILVEPTGTPVAGLSYDSRTDNLFVAKGFGDTNAGVIVYNGTTGAMIADITFEGSRTINDVLVTATGVYCTDSSSPVLYRIPLEAGGEVPASPVVEDVPMNGFVMDSDPTSFNANGIVSSPDGTELIVVNITTGVLYFVDALSGDTTPIAITGDEQLFADGDGLYLDNHMLYICQNFSNKIAVVQLSDNFKEGTFLRNLESPDLDIPTTIIGDGDSIYAINTHFGEIAAGNQAQVLTDVVKLSKSGTDWPDLIPLNVAGIEAEGITLGKDHDFFVGAFSYSTWFGAPISPQAGAIYKGNLRSGEGRILVKPTGTPVAGLSYDPRTNNLFVAKGFGETNAGVIVYNGTTGAMLADITFEGSRTINDVLVTETSVYCTDSSSPVLYRIPLEEDGRVPASPVVEDVPMAGFVMDPDPASFNANGIVSSPDGTRLIVVNITTGVLYLIDALSGDSNPITIAGDEQVFTDGDGLYLDGHTLYICRNFSNKIAAVQLSEDLTQGTFLWNLESPNLDVPTTITGYGDSIYAINTHFGEIAAGNQAQVLTDVAKLPNVGTPSITATDITLENSESIRIGFRSYAPTTMFDFFLETTGDLSGSWDEAAAAELVETPDGYYFQQPRSLAQKDAYFRIGVRTRGAN